MKVEEIVKEKLLERGFSKERILNNRGLISAAVAETVLSIVKNITE